MSAKLAELNIIRTAPALDSLITRLRLAGLIPPPKPKTKPEDDDEFDKTEASPTQVSTESMRRCLGGCGSLFLSKSMGNRICKQCSAHTAFIGAGVDHHFAGSGL
jgi:hypothetical protein